VDPEGYPALPIIESWIELDLDTVASTNTGVFINTPEGNEDHMNNVDGNQLVFLGSQTGNGLEQDLGASYSTGCTYRLTVGVGTSMRFPPSMNEPVDYLELAFYYRDGNEPVDIVEVFIPATGLSSRNLRDFSIYLPHVQEDDDWVGKPIGIAMRSVGAAGGYWDLDNVRLEEFLSASLFIENASFESPEVDPNAFSALPNVDGWMETDIDTLSSANTGVFPNTAIDSPDHITNAHESQLAFLGSQLGNALQQDLAAVYRAGCDYRLTAGICVSGLFPPAMTETVDTIELVFYYRDINEPNQPLDIASQVVEAKGLSSTQLQDFSVHLSTVDPNNAWVGETIGIAIRATGMPGGFWDLDNVRLEEFYPVSLPVANASFESPVVDPEGYPASPIIDMWTELDLDTLGSANTGVFINSPAGSEDHMNNAHGNQIVFLGSQQGNGLEQDLSVSYETGSTYRLTVGVGTSMRLPPSMTEPVDTLQLAFYYFDGNEPVDIVQEIIPATGLYSRNLRDFSVYLPPVQDNDPWADKPIGIAMRSIGAAGGYWDLDNVRVGQSPSIQEK
jgi:urease beta subunit